MRRRRKPRPQGGGETGSKPETPDLPGTPDLPEKVERMLMRALSVATSLDGGHKGCARRACRREGYCRAGVELRACSVPMSRAVEDNALGMMVFLYLVATEKS